MGSYSSAMIQRPESLFKDNWYGFDSMLEPIKSHPSMYIHNFAALSLQLTTYLPSSTFLPIPNIRNRGILYTKHGTREDWLKELPVCNLCKERFLVNEYQDGIQRM
ncbi:unnamed protein product [Cochlearia groenlandica]